MGYGIEVDLKQLYAGHYRRWIEKKVKERMETEDVKDWLRLKVPQKRHSKYRRFPEDRIKELEALTEVELMKEVTEVIEMEYEVNGWIDMDMEERLSGAYVIYYRSDDKIRPIDLDYSPGKEVISIFNCPGREKPSDTIEWRVKTSGEPDKDYGCSDRCRFWHGILDAVEASPTKVAIFVCSE